ncbi:MAG TPA: tyrosine-type recombinase/integrase [Kineosporiaceae bacterium]|nr:tyrosine-type recombinase/integrase [Kineosporiaceae bacterium]
MTGLRTALGDYLTMRRALGFGLVRDEKLLAQFISYLEVHGKDTVTVADTLDWVQLPARAGQGWLNLRLGVVRGLATYLHTLDPTVEVPPRGLLPGAHPRAVPYLYCDADITALMVQAGRLRSAVRAATLATLIGLLAVTGLRIGEAIALDDADFDADAGVLVIRHAKGGKPRLVPLHPSTVTALQAYQHRREQCLPHPVSPALFVSTVGRRLHYNDVNATYIKLVARAGLAVRPAPCRPRIHDLRHSFAVATLLDWYRDGCGIASRLPLLSTYLGHVDPKQTYWYLEAAPELMAEAARRLESPPDTTAGPR